MKKGSYFAGQLWKKLTNANRIIMLVLDPLTNTLGISELQFRKMNVRLLLFYEAKLLTSEGHGTM